jgi:hypothetical protein
MAVMAAVDNQKQQSSEIKAPPAEADEGNTASWQRIMIAIGGH